MKRLIDLTISLIGLILLAPLLILVGLAIKITSPGPIFFRQNRVGKEGKVFKIFKFRTMYTIQPKKSLLITTSDKDPRITFIGSILRKFKLDEIPQLLNVLSGDMSLVGPRPEVEKYVQFYTPEQRKVFSVKPGVTDYASLKYFNENNILSTKDHPEEFYIENIMQDKLSMNINYINESSVYKDLQVIYKTIKRLFH
jgi:lipopolysaccharide/colanic/teichoic acid biosynthesis glycosyltransferase